MMKVREVITDAVSGETIEQWVDMPDVMTPEEAKAADLDRLALEMRAERDRRLSVSDWTMLPDADLTDGQRNEWLTYRQALRDVTAQAGFPTEIDWPLSDNPREVQAAPGVAGE